MCYAVNTNSGSFVLRADLSSHEGRQPSALTFTNGCPRFIVVTPALGCVTCRGFVLVLFCGSKCSTLVGAPWPLSCWATADWMSYHCRATYTPPENLMESILLEDINFISLIFNGYDKDSSKTCLKTTIIQNVDLLAFRTFKRVRKEHSCTVVSYNCFFIDKLEGYWIIQLWGKTLRH